MKSLYLYMIRTDNKNVKILSVFPNKPDCLPTPVPDITVLHLPQSFTNTLTRTIDQYSNRYYTWMETAKNFNELKESLAKRAVTGMYYTTVLCPFEYDPNYNTTDPNLKTTKPLEKTMIQKLGS